MHDRKYEDFNEYHPNEILTLEEEAKDWIKHSSAMQRMREPELSPVEDIKWDTGLRFNEGKLRYDLLPPDAIEEVVKVFTMGAKKYTDRNWELGMPWMTIVASLKRHMAAWELGELKDTESGLLHTAHLAWNALALLTYELRCIGEDNRPKLHKAHPQQIEMEI